jgi:hypothetical protein
MPARRKSISELVQSGTFGRNPARYRNRAAAQAAPQPPLGRVPKHLSATEKSIWTEIASDAPRGQLVRGDRLCLELAVRLVLRLRTTQPKPSEIRLLATLLAKLGLTPQDRARMDLPVTEPPPSGAEAEKWAALDELD